MAEILTWVNNLQTLCEWRLTVPLLLLVYTDSSVTETKSGWGYTVKQRGVTIHSDSAAYRQNTSSLTMEVEAVTHALQWLATRKDGRKMHAVIITDSMNLRLQKIKSGLIIEGTGYWLLLAFTN